MNTDDTMTMGIERLVTLAVFDHDNINLLALIVIALVGMDMWMMVLVGMRSKGLACSRIGVEKSLVILRALPLAGPCSLDGNNRFSLLL